MADGKVLGIGGLFFRARDPDALTAWYRDVLGVGAGCASGDTAPSDWYWQAQGGETVFAPFKADTDYFAADKQFMLNLRVAGLDALVARLEGLGLRPSGARNGTIRSQGGSPGSTIRKATRSNCGSRRRGESHPPPFNQTRSC